MPRLQTSIGKVIAQSGTTSFYVVAVNSRPITALWDGPTPLVRGDTVIVHKVDVSKDAHIIGVSFGDDIEGRPTSALAPQSGIAASPQSAPPASTGENVGAPGAGSSTFLVAANQKYGLGPVIIPFGSASFWMQAYGQNTGGTVTIQGAVYQNSGGSVGTISGTPGQLLGTTNVVTIAGSQDAAWYTLEFASPLTLDAGQYHLAIIVGGTSFLAGFSTANIYNRYGPDSDDFSNGPSNPFGSATTTPKQYAAITIDMSYASTVGGNVRFDLGPGLDYAHLR